MAEIQNHLVDIKQQLKDRRLREKTLLADPEIMDVLCAHIAAGGTLITLCEIWDVSFGRIATWVNKDKDRYALMSEAYAARSEWARERILHELRMMAHSDVRKLYDASGNLLPPQDWPAEMARSVESIDTHELFQGSGEERELIGLAKKVKLHSKIKALELLGKTEAMFVERHEIGVAKTLADLIEETHNREMKDVTPE